MVSRYVKTATTADAKAREMFKEHAESIERSSIGVGRGQNLG